MPGPETQRVMVLDGTPEAIDDYRAILCPGPVTASEGPGDRLEQELFGATAEHKGFPEIELEICRRATDAIDALRRAATERRPFSLALVDPDSLAGADGVEVLEQMRAVDAALHIVVVTAGPVLHPADLCQRVAPADRLHLLRKPFHAAEIQHLVLASGARRAGETADAEARSRLPGRTRDPGANCGAMLELFPAATMMFDRQDRLLAANAELSRLFPALAASLRPGVGYEEIQWRMARHLLPEDTLYREDNWVRDRLQWHAAGGGMLEQRLRGPRWVMLAETSFDSGLTCCQFHDITDLKQRETSRSHAARMTQMAQAFGALCDRLYRNPGHLGHGQRGSKVVSLRAAKLGTLGRSGQGSAAADGKLHGLAGKLRAVAQRQMLTPETLDLNHEVTRALGEARDLVPPDVSVEVIGGIGLWNVLADPGKLRSVLLELITNACEALDGGGALVLETANVRLARDFVASRPRLAAGDYVRITVQDGGAGMAPELADRAFNPFFTSKSDRAHLGLGLSVAHGFINQSGGHIEIRQVEGGGTAVDLFLPRTRRALLPAGDFDDAMITSSE